jgi:hypothetical protein
MSRVNLKGVPMAGLKSTPQSQGFGFDPKRSLLVLPWKKTHSMYLIAGADLTIKIDDETRATYSERAPGSKKGVEFTPWEKEQVIRRIDIMGEAVGSTVLNANTPDGRPWIQPLEIRVVDNADGRQAEGKTADRGAGTIKVAPKLREEIQGLSFREALIRVAEDQMNSAVGRTGSGGDGRYDEAGINWCGSFAYWCYAVVSLAKGVANPFGSASPVNNPLRSGIKALHAGMKDEGKFTVIRYEGPDRFGGLKKPQKFIELDADNPVLRGDICLPRKDKGDTFPHVCLVYDPPDGSGKFTTIDGNQTGAFRPEGASPYCIGVNAHDANKKWKDGKTYAFAFVHVKTI